MEVNDSWDYHAGKSGRVASQRIRARRAQDMAMTKRRASQIQLRSLLDKPLETGHRAGGAATEARSKIKAASRRMQRRSKTLQTASQRRWNMLRVMTKSGAISGMQFAFQYKSSKRRLAGKRMSMRPGDDDALHRGGAAVSPQAAASAAGRTSRLPGLSSRPLSRRMSSRRSITRVGFSGDAEWVRAWMESKGLTAPMAGPTERLHRMAVRIGHKEAEQRSSKRAGRSAPREQSTAPGGDSPLAHSAESQLPSSAAGNDPTAGRGQGSGITRASRRHWRPSPSPSRASTASRQIRKVSRPGGGSAESGESRQG